MIGDNLVNDIQKRIASALKVNGFDVGFADGNAENQAACKNPILTAPHLPIRRLPITIETMRILIVKLGSIGDIIHTLPSLAA